MSDDRELNPYSKEESDAYTQGLRDGKIAALEERHTALDLKLGVQHNEFDRRLVAMEVRQEKAEKLLYILAVVVAISQAEGVTGIIMSAVAGGI